MLFEVKSQRTIEEIDGRLNEAAARHSFGILAKHDLKSKMKEKGVDFSGDCLIYEVCNPVQAKKILEANPAVSTALPCRISVYSFEGGRRISTILPTEMMKMFGNPELEPVAAEVEATLQAMIRESA